MTLFSVSFIKNLLLEVVNLNGDIVVEIEKVDEK